ncbi:MAG: DDE-type integrase/transposase/recombinase [Bacteroidetes bacterium]|nr:DDE-type integrase/transposase/recombinase [Bacteroidota bacterium]
MQTTKTPSLIHNLGFNSRRVVGWAVDKRMKKDPPLRALKQAIILRQPAEGIIHHSDRGSQYCSDAYQQLLEKHGFKISMSDKGNCYDNGAMEGFSKPSRRN